MTYLYIGLAIVLVVLIAMLIRASRHTYHPDSGGTMGRSRQSTLDNKERGAKWGTGM